MLRLRHRPFGLLTENCCFTVRSVDTSGNASTGESVHATPTILPATQKWVFTAERDIGASPALGFDETVYVCSGGELYAINPDGTEKWCFSKGSDAGPNGTPAIGSDGTIYVGSYEGLYAINPDGTEKWFHGDGEVVGSPAINSDGSICCSVRGKPYPFENGSLLAVNPDGTRKWRFFTGSQFEPTSPVIAADGTVYIGAYMTGSWGGDSSFYAVNPDGTKKWESYLEDAPSSAAIGEQGTVYMGTMANCLIAMNPDGSEKWRFEDLEFKGPAIGSDGSIYAGSYESLWAIDSNGTMKWQFVSDASMWTCPAIAADGTVYMGLDNNTLLAINPDGTEKWVFDTGEYIYGSNPTVGSDGTVYISAGPSLYAIHDGSGGLASSPWPMFQQNPQHTGLQSTP